MIKVFCILAVLLPLAPVYGFHIQPRIIEGIVSKPSDFKFFVLVRANFFPFFHCGGVLISDRWVLTAAHCLAYEQLLTVFIGLNENRVIDDLIEIPAEYQYIHPEYIDTDFLPNDIGLIKLPRNIEQSVSFQPVKLSNKCGTDLDNIDVITMGTGDTSLHQEETIEYVLRHLYAKTISSDECERRVKARQEGPYSVICVNQTDDGGSVAPGDSGGPLLQRSDGSLIGLTSFIYGENAEIEEVTLQAFTRIHTYFDWIYEVTGLEMPVCDDRQPIA